MSIPAPERAKRHLMPVKNGRKNNRDILDRDPVEEWRRRVKEYEDDYWRNRLRKLQ